MQSHSTWAALTQINPLEKQKWNVGMKFCCVLLGSIVFKKAISDGLCELGFPVGLKYGPPYDANNWITENIGIKVCCFFIGSILSCKSEPQSHWGLGITRSQIQTRCLCCGWWSLTNWYRTANENYVLWKYLPSVIALWSHLSVWVKFWMVIIVSVITVISTIIMVSMISVISKISKIIAISTISIGHQY